MSTDLYGIRVLELAPDEGRMRLRVFVVYYDTGYASHQPIPSDRSFFVRVLCDKDALGEDISSEGRFDESHVDRNAFRYVERFVELELRNHPLESYAGYSDFYYERDGRWQDEDKLVQADYDVFVTKPEYLAPFELGQSWGTTAYPTQADALRQADYDAIPDFGDANSFTPFPGVSQDASTARSMRFSADSSHLLVSHDAGGFCVFDLDDGEVVLEEAKVGGWDFSPSWTHDGRVAGNVGDAFVAFELGSGAREPFAPFGCAGNSSGTRFFNLPHDETLQLLDEQGRVLFEREGAPELVINAGYDASGSRCALLVETEALRLIDVDTGAVRELELEGLGDVALSPDARYILASGSRVFMVIRAADGEVLRALPAEGGYPTCVAWSPDGKLAATSLTDANGYHSKVRLHRIGSEVVAAQARARALPERAGQDLRDLADLYLRQTEDFSPGWSSHLDDNLLDFHLTLTRMGLEHDLVPRMHEDQTRIAARAYESVLAHQRGDASRAAAALADASARLEAAGELAQWCHSFVYAPLAAARFLAGDEAGAAASWELAQVGLDDESNPFQKRAVVVRALLIMGRAPEAREILLAEEGSWVGQFHLRSLSDLIDAGCFELLTEAWTAWGAAEEWDARELVLARLRESGALEHAAALGFDADALDGDGDDEDGEGSPSSDDGLDPSTLEPADRVAWWGMRGRWAEAYALIDGTKATLRSALYRRAAAVASKRGDLHIVLDVLGMLPSGDMNAPGMRALQAAFARLGAPHHREWHP